MYCPIDYRANGPCFTLTGPVEFYPVLPPFALSWDPQRQDKFSCKEDDFDAAEN